MAPTSQKPPGSPIGQPAGAAGAAETPERVLNILHVEDDDIDAKIVSLCLAQYRGRRIRIHRAHTTDEARALLKERDIDLVILDFWLGNESSLKLLSEVGGRGGLLPAIVLSGLSTPQTRAVVLKNGALAFVGKDRLSAGVLEDAIESALAAYAAEADLMTGGASGPFSAAETRFAQIEGRFNDILTFLDQMHEHAVLADMLPGQRNSHLHALETIADDARAAIFSGIADLRQNEDGEAGGDDGRIDLRIMLDDVHELMRAILDSRRQRLICERPDIALFTGLRSGAVTPLLAELVAMISRQSADGAVLTLNTHYEHGRLCITISGHPARPGQHPALTVRLPSLSARLAAEGMTMNEDLTNGEGPTLTITLPTAENPA